MIDVLNHIWVGVFSASVVSQCREQKKPGRLLDHDRIVRDASELAETMLMAYRRMCADDRKAQS